MHLRVQYDLLLGTVIFSSGVTSDMDACGCIAIMQMKTYPINRSRVGYNAVNTGVYMKKMICESIRVV